MSPTPSRKEIAKLGTRGRWVRVVEGTHRSAKVYWVEYKKEGRRTAAPFPRTRAGKVAATNYAVGIAVEQERGAAPAAPLRLTVAELWARYVEAEFPAFRPNTKRIYRDGWKPWSLFVGPATIAEDLGRDSMAQLRAELDRRGWAVNTIRKTFGVIRAVYKWGLEGELLQRNRVGTYVYKVAKEQRPESPAEFRTAELDQLLAALPLDSARHWRAHGVLAICGNQGARQWAVLHLTWPDLAFDAGDTGEITWQRAWDKTGKTWTQPMREATRAVLEVALLRRAEEGYQGPYVFFPGRTGNRQGFYTEQSLWRALQAAEAAAGITHLKGRGAHGLRRLLAGEVNELTGNMKTAMDAIGDSVRMAERYLRPRNDQLIAAFKALDARRKTVAPEAS